MVSRELIAKLTEERDDAKANLQLGMYLRIAEVNEIIERLEFLEQLMQGSDDD